MSKRRITLAYPQLIIFYSKKFENITFEIITYDFDFIVKE